MQGAAWRGVFKRAFPGAYRELYSPHQALAHIELFDALKALPILAIATATSAGCENNHLQLKLFHREQPLELSDMIPDAGKSRLSRGDGASLSDSPGRRWRVWMQEFQLSFSLDVNVDVGSGAGQF